MSIGNRHRGRVTRRRAPRGARTAFFAACFLVVPLIGGCADETAPPMVITAIEPATVSALVDTPARISGQNFLNDASASLHDDAPEVDRRWGVRIGPTALAAGNIAYVDPQAIDIVVPLGLPAGAHDVTVTSPAGAQATLPDGLSVEGQESFQVSIESEPGGDGEPVPDQLLLVGELVTLHAVLRTEQGAFVEDLAAEWSVTGEVGAVEPASGTMSIFGAQQLGEGAVVAESPPAASDVVAVQVTTACDGPEDCNDPCRSTNDCIDGKCFIGPIDKDSDGDGAIDEACGGDDCDDEPTGCGADCYPGNAAADDCDGQDQDCDDAVDEDFVSAPTTCGQGVCAGNAGTLTCVAGSVVDTCDPMSGSSPEGPVAHCTDSQDNDCDGLTDGADPSCGHDPPLAKFVVSPGGGTTSTVFTFDASVSTDTEDAATALRYSWDWDADGSFDQTLPLGTTSVTHVFSTAGLQTVVLRVEDSDGMDDFFGGWVSVVAPANLIVVDTDQDVVNGGDGLTSLREALVLAQQPGADTITFAGPMTIVLTATLKLQNDDDTTVIGQPGVEISGTGFNDECIEIVTNNNQLLALTVVSCNKEGDLVTGNGNTVAHCLIDICGTNGVAIKGVQNQVGPHNEIYGHGEHGIWVDGGVDDLVLGNRVMQNIVGIGLKQNALTPVIRGNFIAANDTGIEIGPTIDDTVIWHNSLYLNVHDGITYLGGPSSTGHDIRNNIFASSGGAGIDLANKTATVVDYNAYHDNTGADCSPSCAGPNALVGQDPLFIGTPSYDLRLQWASPCIDAGFDLGLDVNGPAPGNFSPPSPDIGGWEALWP